MRVCVRKRTTWFTRTTPFITNRASLFLLTLGIHSSGYFFWDSILRATSSGIPFSGLLPLGFHSSGYFLWDSILRATYPGIPISGLLPLGFHLGLLPLGFISRATSSGIPFLGLLPWDFHFSGYLWDPISGYFLWISISWATFWDSNLLLWDSIPRRYFGIPFSRATYPGIPFGYFLWDSIPRATSSGIPFLGLLTLGFHSRLTSSGISILGLLPWARAITHSILLATYLALPCGFHSRATYLGFHSSGYIPWDSISPGYLPWDSILGLLPLGFHSSGYLPGISIPRANLPGIPFPRANPGISILGLLTLGFHSSGLLTPGIPFLGLLTPGFHSGYLPWAPILGLLPLDSTSRATYPGIPFLGLLPGIPFGLLTWDSIPRATSLDSISLGLLYPGIPFLGAGIPFLNSGIPFSGLLTLGIPFSGAIPLDFPLATYPGIPFPRATSSWDSILTLPWDSISSRATSLGFHSRATSSGIPFSGLLPWDSILRAIPFLRATSSGISISDSSRAIPFSGLLTLRIPFLRATYPGDSISRATSSGIPSGYPGIPFSGYTGFHPYFLSGYVHSPGYFLWDSILSGYFLWDFHFSALPISRATSLGFHSPGYLPGIPFSGLLTLIPFLGGYWIPLGAFIPSGYLPWDSISRATSSGIPFLGLLPLGFHSPGYFLWDSIPRATSSGIPFLGLLPLGLLTLGIPFSGLLTLGFFPTYLGFHSSATSLWIPIPGLLTLGFHSRAFYPGTRYQVQQCLCFVSSR
ncbi:hypothetical protein C7M84_010713, partial [Penaeus vannamei]